MLTATHDVILFIYTSYFELQIWSLGSPDPNFTLDGHQKGVNCVDYFTGGDRPYLITGSDDSTAKVWDYQTKSCVQTLEGHTHNISDVCFHPELPIIITGSEDVVEPGSFGGRCGVHSHHPDPSFVLVDNLVEDLSRDFEYETHPLYLLYRNAAQEVNGIWFDNQHYCEAVTSLFG
ncbi:hypothetical protein ACJX0J_040773, partial [Zea mays]